MKYLKTLLIISVVIGLILGAKFIFFPGNKEKKPLTGVKPVPSATAVTVFVASNSDKGDLLFANGSIVANEDAELHPETSGRIEYINIPEGKEVKKGMLLLKINDNDIQAQLNKIKSQLKLAEGNLQRQNNLLKIEGASQLEFDQAFANLSSLKADSAYFQSQILKTEVFAPFNGVLGIRQVSMGSYVTPATIITSISQINPVKIDFFLPEKYSSLLSNGDQIICTSENNKTFKAKIVVIDPKIDLANRSVRYRAITPNPGGQLKPGSFVRIELKLKGNNKALFIPTESVIATLKGKKVFLVKNGKAQEKEIETGLRTAQNIQVFSGITLGDSVIVTGNLQLKPGSAIKVIPTNLTK